MALMDILGNTCLSKMSWDGLFFVLFCLWCFTGAKVGLVCSHVWLGHLVAHTNDPNWESGLSFRVTDRLTGMWGMWPGGTLLLSGPAYQLAAYRSGHLSARIAPQMENDLLFPPELCMQNIFSLASCAFWVPRPKSKRIMQQAKNSHTFV